MFKAPYIVPDLVREFAGLMTGLDCNSTGVWLNTYITSGLLEEEVRQAVIRACLHWEACSDNDREVVGPFFGMGEPHNERWPFAKVIQGDYVTFLSLVTQLFDDEPYSA